MSNRGAGVFVVLEGADGSGKTTIADHLIHLLQADGIPARRTTRLDPDGPAAYADVVAAVSRLFGAADGLLTPLHLLGLAAATQHALIAHSQALPAVEAGEVVIADTWWAKTWARLVVEGRRCLAYDEAASLAFARWLASLLASPPFEELRPLIVLIDSSEDDRVRWYVSSEHRQAVYDRYGQTTTDPHEFGRFTAEVQAILHSQAQQHGWHLVANHTASNVATAAAHIVRLVHRQQRPANEA